MKLKLVLVVVCFVLVSVICTANPEYEEFKNHYNTNYEIATSGISSYLIQNNTLVKLDVRASSRLFKGNNTYVMFWYKRNQNTVIHTHTGTDCNPSYVDYNFINKSRYIKVSIILCINNTLVMIKDNNTIKVYPLKRED